MLISAVCGVLAAALKLGKLAIYVSQEFFILFFTLQKKIHFHFQLLSSVSSHIM